MQGKVLLEVQGLKKYFPITSGFFRRTVGHVRAVDDVSFTIRQGETLGLVGESGCGKTTVGRCILRAIKPTAGKVYYHADNGAIDITALQDDSLRAMRRQMQLIFQDPYSSLNPRMTVREIVGEPLLIHGVKDRQERDARVRELLKQVGIRPEYMNRYPHAFSGGQRQRIGIARALALDPSFIVCDETVSALDVSIQAQILNLLQDLQEKLNLTYLFIAHDLSVVEHISDRVAVMYVGRIVEVADTVELFSNPRHPYTEALLAAVPRASATADKDEILLEGEVPDPANPPQGCHFHPRCKYATDICKRERPELSEVSGDSDHAAACHFASQLSLRGVS
jgi:peptide/nickel transport system ATP-binding protein